LSILRLDRSGAVAWLQRDVDARGMKPADRLLTLRDARVRQLDLARSSSSPTSGSVTAA